MKHSYVPYWCRALLSRASRARVLLVVVVVVVVAGFDLGGWSGAARHGTAPLRVGLWEVVRT